MKRVLIVFPTEWDHKQLAACRRAWHGRYEIIISEPSDVDCAWNFDILSFIDETVERYRGRIDGVFSSSDYPGATVAGAIATELSLPGSKPQSVIRSSHKYYSRLAQAEAVPEATPWCAVIDPANLERSLEQLRFPCFVKPVKGAFSIMSRKVHSADELTAMLASPDTRDFLTQYVEIFDRLVGRFTDFEFGGRIFLAEELLHGVQVTVDGFASHDGEIEILGVVDSVMHTHAPSFARFDYPSSLAPEIQQRMADIARRAIAHLGLTHSLFNIELIYDATADRVSIIEINPRICGQFGDLYEKVDGTNSYEIALSLAVGDRPAFQHRAGRFAAAASVPLRVFEPTRVVRAPDEMEIRQIEAANPGTLVWSECQTGDVLSDFQDEDGSSHRYAIINIGGDDHTDVLARIVAIQHQLGFQFETPNL